MKAASVLFFIFFVFNKNIDIDLHGVPEYNQYNHLHFTLNNENKSQPFDVCYLCHIGEDVFIDSVMYL